MGSSFRTCNLRAVEAPALPAADKTFVGANFCSKETGENAGLLLSGIEGEMPSIGELVDADGLLRGGEITLAATAGSSDHGAAA